MEKIQLPTPLQPLEVLQYVNGFYSESFTQLITLFGVLCGLVGIVIPILYWVVQKRFFKAENQEIKNSIQKELREEYNLEIKKISEVYLKKEKEYEDKILGMEKKLVKEIEKVSAGVYYVQGNMLIESSRFLGGFMSFLKAGRGAIISDNEKILKQVIKVITKTCLPGINKSQLNNEENIVKSYEDFIGDLTKYDVNGRYTDDIRNIKIEYKKASERS